MRDILRTKLLDLKDDIYTYIRVSKILSSLQLFFFARKVRTGSEGYTMVKRKNLYRLFYASKSISKQNIGGVYVECGSWNGGAAALCAYALGNNIRDFYIFDSFEGLPKPTENDGERANRLYRKGWCLGYPEKVKEAFEIIKFPKDRLHIIKGWFKNTFPENKIEEIALLHIDADLYDSVYLCLETYYSKVVKGGYVFFDDYSSWEGCRKAVEDYFKKNNIDIAELIDSHYIIKK